MANANVSTFTDANFDTEVLASKQPVLVDFWAEWCRPCKMMEPTIDGIAADYAGRVKVGKVDTDANRDVSVKCGIQAIPTIILFKDGQVKKKFVGIQGPGDLAAALDELLK